MNLAHTSKIQTTDDICEALSFHGNPQNHDLRMLYTEALEASHRFSADDVRIAWKIASDPYYWSVLTRHQSMQGLVEAGFFDDHQEPGVIEDRADVQFLATPLEAIRKNILHLESLDSRQDKPLVVAISTGCFAPVHEGHVAMMECAKKALEKQGYDVLGGFMSPSHDDYATSKDEFSKKFIADHRIALLNKALEKSDWLATDPWESRYGPTDINFTDTIQRLEKYINTHIKTPVPIQVVYVFGSDNAMFAHAFADRGLAVCIPRPGHEKALEDCMRRSNLINNPHIVLADSSGLELSSSYVRHAENNNSKQTLNSIARKSSSVPPTQTYLVRDDLNWATNDWSDKIEIAKLQIATDKFRDGLAAAIQRCFENSQNLDYPDKVDIVFLSADEQIEHAEKIVSENPNRVLNNDVVTGGNQSIGLSRLFSLSAHQPYSKELVIRSKTERLCEMFRHLDAGTYTIIDDDIATGSTIRMIEEQLPDGVVIGDKIALSELAFKQSYPDREYAFWDIVDARDFLMGSRSSGLVVQLFNGAVARAPYIQPYTSLVSRAKIPPDQEIAFTKEIIKLNENFFRDIRVDLNLENTDPQFQALMQSIGFTDQVLMNDLCAWHQCHTYG